MELNGLLDTEEGRKVSSTLDGKLNKLREQGRDEFYLSVVKFMLGIKSLNTLVKDADTADKFAQLSGLFIIESLRDKYGDAEAARLMYQAMSDADDMLHAVAGTKRTEH